jgi:hypothetical protein
MNRKLAYAALSLVIVLGGASGALAGKKSYEALQAHAAEAVADPRNAHHGGNHPTWCDIDPQCNGWALWLQETSAGKLKN